MENRKIFCYPIEKIIYKNPDTDCPGSPATWINMGQIGESSQYGNIYKIQCDEFDRTFVLKYINLKLQNHENVIHEVEMQIECADLKLCPPIIEAWTCKHGATIVMSTLDITVRRMLIEFNDEKVLENIVRQVIKLVNKLHDNDIYHGDCHLDNIMCKYNTFIEDDHESEIDIYKERKYKYFFIDMAKSGFMNRELGVNVNEINDFIKIYNGLGGLGGDKKFLQKKVLKYIQKLINNHPPEEDIKIDLRNSINNRIGGSVAKKLISIFMDE